MNSMRLLLKKVYPIAVLLALSGCAPVLLAAGAVAGYAVSRDSVVLDLDHPVDRVWDAAVEEVKAAGTLKKENPKRRRLDAQIDEADVVVTVKALSPSTVRVVVRARKTLLPKPDVAQRVAFGIQRRVERSQPLF